MQVVDRWKHSRQHGVLCKLDLTSKHESIANPGCGSGWRNNIQIYFLIQVPIFNQQRLRADGILIPKLPKTMTVTGQAKKTTIKKHYVNNERIRINWNEKGK